MKRLLAITIFIAGWHSGQASGDSLIIQNRNISRVFHFDKGATGFYSTGLFNKASAENYINPATEEFSITINDSVVEGNNCRFKTYEFSKTNFTQTLTVILETSLPDVYISLVYQLYEDLPLVRKQLRVINQSNSSLSLTNADVEKLRLQVVNKFDNEVYSGYGSNINRIPYKGDCYDAAIMLFNSAEHQGVILGNEAPGVLKNTEIYTQIHGCIQIGMRHMDEDFPFKKTLEPGDTFISPRTFIYVFNSAKWQEGFENQYKEFTRKYLDVSLFSRSGKPLMMYDTWRPFLDSINENIITGSADNLMTAGADLFIIDAGWYKYSGDFIPDSSKFQNGMNPVGDFLHKKGMQVGLWFPAAIVNAKSKIAMQHPAWLIKDKKGQPANLHDMSLPSDGTGWHDGLATMSLASPYYDHLKKLVSDYTRQLDLPYVKFDLSIVNSAYVHEPARSGDYETNEFKRYDDRAASYWMIYERMMQLMDDLHRQFPRLLIDCTFEVWGRYNLVDFALIQHADYVWLTNFEQPPPAGPISIRQMNFDRSRVLPTSTLLIGNQSLNFSNYKYVYFSLASSNLVFVGDARKLLPEQKSFYNKWNTYLKQIEKKYQYSKYFQLYDVFDRPTDSNWDGCYRINTEKQGGLMFFYRNNSPDFKRSFRIPCLESRNRYRVYSFDTNKTLGIFSGKELMEAGLTVNIPTVYSAMVLTIEKI